MTDNKNYTELKYCIECKQLYTKAEYNTAKNRCKKCISKYMHTWRKQNRAEIRDYFRKWTNNNRDRMIQHYYKRRALEQGQIKKVVSKAEWEYILNYFNYSCAYCNMTISEHKLKYNQTLHREHIVNISSGGDCSIDNIVPSCKSCNSSKYTSNWEEWYTDSDQFNIKNYNKILDYINTDHSTKIEKNNKSKKKNNNTEKTTA